MELPAIPSSESDSPSQTRGTSPLMGAELASLLRGSPPSVEVLVELLRQQLLRARILLFVPAVYDQLFVDALMATVVESDRLLTHVSLLVGRLPVSAGGPAPGLSDELLAARAQRRELRRRARMTAKGQV